MNTQAIYCYRNEQEENIGPMTIDDLRSHLQQGTIGKDTYAISIIDKQWTTVGQILKNHKTHTSKLPSAIDSEQRGILAMDHKISQLLTTIITFGKLNPDNTETLRGRMNQIGALQVLLTLIGTPVLCLALGLTVSRDWGWIMVFPGIILGFLLQYISYLFTTTNAKLLTSGRITFVSMLIPRLIGTLALIAQLYYIVCLFIQSRQIPGNIAAIAVCGVVAWLCFRADRYLVTIAKQDIQPGRECISIARFCLRVTCIVAHICMPVILASQIFTKLIQALSGPSWGSLLDAGYRTISTFNIEKIIDSVIAYIMLQLASNIVPLILPLVIYLVFCASSLVFDIVDNLLQNKKTQPDATNSPDNT